MILSLFVKFKVWIIIIGGIIVSVNGKFMIDGFVLVGVLLELGNFVDI